MIDERYDIESGVRLCIESDRRGLVWVILETAAGRVVALSSPAAHHLASLITRHCPPPEARDD